MAPKSAAALVLLAAIAGLALALPLQAQLDPRAMDSLFNLVNGELCSGDDAIKICVSQLVESGSVRIPLDCCGALLKAVASGEAGKGCACGFGVLAANLGFDVDRGCLAARNGGITGGPSKLEDICKVGLPN